MSFQIQSTSAKRTYIWTVSLLLLWLLSRSCHAFVDSKPAIQTQTRTALRASSSNDARQLLLEGMQAFRQGNIEKSIQLFDQVDALRPDLTPYLWQRGISLYYADRFQEASNQFRTDVRVNPWDVEEIVWDTACQLRLSPDFPPKNQMALPRGKRDPRKIMVCSILANQRD